MRILEEEIRKSETPIRECKEIPSAPRAKETLSLETNLETLVAEMGNVNKSSDVLKRNLLELIEHYHVLKKANLWLKANHLVTRRIAESELEQGSVSAACRYFLRASDGSPSVPE